MVGDTEVAFLCNVSSIRSLTKGNGLFDIISGFLAAPEPKLVGVSHLAIAAAVQSQFSTSVDQRRLGPLVSYCGSGNVRATTGKNLQMPSRGVPVQIACEVRAVSPSAPNDITPALSISLAERQRRPSKPVQNYGGRKLRCRDPDNLKPWQVHQLYIADARATQLGLPLNTFLSIYWEATFGGSVSMPSTFRRGMKRMGQWLRDKGARFVWCFVHENPGDANLNSHLLLHVPAGLRRAFKAKAGDWFDAMDGGVLAEPRNDAQRAAKGFGTRLQYMAKGADFLTCRRYGGFRAKGGQGPVHVKRSGVAQCLGQFSEQYAHAREEQPVLKATWRVA